MADRNIKFLTPQRFDAEPGAQDAQRAFKHWHRTFEHFLHGCEKNATTDFPLDKLGMLNNYISHSVYEYITDADTYESAMATLKALYVKTPSVIFARYKLATHKQQSGQSIDNFYRDLKMLCRLLILGQINNLLP